MFGLALIGGSWIVTEGSTLFAHMGFGSLGLFIGIACFFIAAPILLQPLHRIIRETQLTSLPDLLAFRFNSLTIGLIATLTLLFSGLMFQALEINALYRFIVSNTDSPVLGLGAVAGMMMLASGFSLGIAWQRTRPDAHSQLLGNLAAWLGSTKLLLLCLATLLALHLSHGGFRELEHWLDQHPESIEAVKPWLSAPGWISLMFMGFAMVLVTPALFHFVLVLPSTDRDQISTAWSAQVVLLLMAVSMPLLVWSGTPGPLALTMMALSAMAGLSITLTLTWQSLATMCLNHLVLPLLQIGFQADIYRLLLVARRSILTILTLLTLLTALLVPLDAPQLEWLIILLGTAGQLAPAIIASMYWPRASWVGVLSGLVACAPILILLWIMGLQPGALPELGQDFQLGWQGLVCVATIVNICILFLVSQLTGPSDEEIDAARRFSPELGWRESHVPVGYAPDSMENTLRELFGEDTAHGMIQQALGVLELSRDEHRHYELHRLRLNIQDQIAALLGPNVAQDLMDRFFPLKGERQEEALPPDLSVMESRLEAYRSRLSGMTRTLDNMRRHHRQTLEDIPLPVLTLDDHGTIVFWNQAMTRLTTLRANKVIGKTLEQLNGPWGPTLKRFANSLTNQQRDVGVDTRQGRHWVNLHKAFIGASQHNPHGGTVLLLEDITDRRMLEQHLMHSERLASIGRLAAGVAHEIGNPVTGIQYLAREIRDESQEELSRNNAGQIIDQTQRVARILQSLVSFAHAGRGKQNDYSHHPTCFDLRESVREAINLLSLSDKTKDVAFINVCNPLIVYGDPQKLQQVMVNLLSNARDACPEFAHVYIEGVTDETSAVLSITDEGPGIPEHLQTQVFEPFYTTKPAGEGTGLGLPLVHSIIEQHNGQIRIESPANLQTGRGARFIIRLPLTTEGQENYGQTAAD
jgi:PAS domain S-box-containing protein